MEFLDLVIKYRLDGLVVCNLINNDCVSVMIGIMFVMFLLMFVIMWGLVFLVNNFMYVKFYIDECVEFLLFYFCFVC